MRLIYADDRVHGPSENWQFACKFRATNRCRSLRVLFHHRIGEIPRILRSGGEVAPGRCLYGDASKDPSKAREETLESAFLDISISIFDVFDIAMQIL